MRTSDDYYNRWEVASFARILRYVASFFAMTLPGLYLAVTNFHTQILPTSLMLSFAEARAGVPFPGGGSAAARRDGKYDWNRGRLNHRTGGGGGKSGELDGGHFDIIYGAMFLCDSK